MPRPRKSRPQLDALESRELLTTLPAAPDLLAAPAPVAAQVHAETLPVHGTLTKVHSIPDVGTTYRLAGSGDLATVGRVAVKGSLHATGFIAQGHASGTVTVSGRRGSFQMDLTGPPQAGFSDLPSTFHYVVVSASRNYAGKVGQAGTAHFQFGSASTHARSFSVSLS